MAALSAYREINESLLRIHAAFATHTLAYQVSDITLLVSVQKDHMSGSSAEGSLHFIVSTAACFWCLRWPCWPLPH